MKSPLLFRFFGDCLAARPSMARDRKFPARSPRSLRRGFTLVEVALALGISAFALVGVVGLLPLGLTASRRSADNLQGTYIAQRVIGELVQTDFSELVSDPKAAQENYTFRKPVRYFDADGNETSKAASAIYYVNTRVLPATPVSGIKGEIAASNQQTAMVTVQVAINPAGKEIPLEEGGAADLSKPLRNLWKPTSSISLATQSAMVARVN